MNVAAMATRSIALTRSSLAAFGAPGAVEPPGCGSGCGWGSGCGPAAGTVLSSCMGSPALVCGGRGRGRPVRTEQVQVAAHQFGPGRHAQLPEDLAEVEVDGVRR